ncbi:unnamed protein product, partial [Iphiclides podalirius]
MARLVLCSLALLLAGALADSTWEIKKKVADQVFLKQQVDVLSLFFHIHEPIHVPELQDAVNNWDLQKNINLYTNASAVQIYAEMLKEGLMLPRTVPFSVLEPTHVFETKVLFNVLYSAKDFDTFFKTAAFLRNKINEGLFVPNHFHLDQPEFIEAVNEIIDIEHRIREAIDTGYVINPLGEHISIHSPEAIDILGSVIEANADSVNPQYYKNFISVWKKLLGNTVWHKHQYHKNLIPLVVPSVLEHYQTALQDPAFYMIWKRVLGLFTYWQKQFSAYKKEELALPSVVIKSVEVDKLVTYFEHTYVNVTNHLHMNDFESKAVADDISVVVQRPQLNHKTFNVRVNVKNEVAKTVVVKFFLAPKYDSDGYEIPLHVNTENFYLLDQFLYDLPVGDVTIKRNPSDNWFTIRDWTPAYQVYEKANDALHGKGQFVIDKSQRLDGFPDHLLLPKGRVGGMPFVFLVYISEYRSPKVPYASNFDASSSLGLGSGARWMNDEPFGFPLDRPLYQWQIKDLHNIYVQDVSIVHKQVPEVMIPHVE